MIVYLVTAEHAYTVGRFFDSWGTEWRHRIAVVPYAEALEPRPAGWAAWRRPRRSLPERATWIFSDVERLAAGEAEAAAGLWGGCAPAALAC